MAVHEIKIPSPGESITEVEIGNWLKQDGDLVQIDESLCEIETDKATLPLVAEVTGRLKIILEQGSVANVGDVACSIDSDAVGLVQENKSASKSSAPLQEETPLLAEKKDSQETGYPKGHPSPAARKMIEERGLEMEQIEGTGPGGRILKQDVPEKKQEVPKEVQSNQESVTAEDNRVQEGSDASSQSLGSAEISSGKREVKRQRMSRLRRKLSERLVAVKNETAMLTTFNEVDMQQIFDLRGAVQRFF